MNNNFFYKNHLLKLLLITIISIILFNACGYSNPKDLLQIHFIYVGEGDSILIKDNNFITLIDAGPLENSKELVQYLKKQQISRINNLILSHPHADHFGGMSDVLKEFKVDNFYSPKITVNDDEYKYLLYNLKLKNLDIKTAKNGVKLNMGDSCNGEFLAPSKYSYDNLNNYSAVLRFSYKNNSFIFCGDCEKEEENEILSNYKLLKSDVIKIGHHGSKTATSESFLKSISPHIAIISDGIRNKFNHPHKETLDLLAKYKVPVYRTDIYKSIILNCNGNEIFISTEIKN